MNQSMSHAISLDKVAARSSRKSQSCFIWALIGSQSAHVYVDSGNKLYTA
jgi:hypothetical protein